jgi:putative tryptophan/tyrosine transport system substrate-binding protein
MEVILAPVRNPSELESVIVTQASEPNSGLFVMPDAFTITYRVEVTSLAARHHLPSVYGYRFFAEPGGLLSYGEDLTDNFRRAATYADRILKGEKPSELPVQSPVKFELVINRKTATALGLTLSLGCSASSSNKTGRCRPMAQNGHAVVTRQCLLFGAKPTRRIYEYTP